MKTPGGETDFSKGEFVLFFEVDAFLPKKGNLGRLFSEVGNPCTLDGDDGYRVITKKVASATAPYEVIRSQGHVFKLSSRTFPDIHANFLKQADAIGDMVDGNINTLAETLRGVDYSSILGVKKWVNEKESEAANVRLPSFIIKSDMDRVQNCPNLFKKSKYKRFVYQESVKMDGCSMTLYHINDASEHWEHLHAIPQQYAKRAVLPGGKARYGVCSKNFDLWDSAENRRYWDAALQSGILSILRDIGHSVAIQGELVGWGINGNAHGYPKDKVDFFVFSMFDIDGGKRYDPRKVEKFARLLGLKHTPVLGYVKIPEIASSHQELLDRAENREGEGLVFKNCEDGRWFKVHSVSYIVNREETPVNTTIATPAYTYPAQQVTPPSSTRSASQSPKKVFSNLFPQRSPPATPSRPPKAAAAATPTANTVNKARNPPAAPFKSFNEVLNDQFSTSTATSAAPVSSTPVGPVFHAAPTSAVPTVTAAATNMQNGQGAKIRSALFSGQFPRAAPQTSNRSVPVAMDHDATSSAKALRPPVLASITNARKNAPNGNNSAAMPEMPTTTPVADDSTLPRNGRIKQKIEAPKARKAQDEEIVETVVDAPAMGTPTTVTSPVLSHGSGSTPTDGYQTALEDVDSDSDYVSAEEGDDYHLALDNMPPREDIIIFGDPANPDGWMMKPEITKARIDAWRQASIDRTMLPDDDDLGTWNEEWAMGYYGVDNPMRPKDVNNLYFTLNPHEYRPEYRKERHPNLFPNYGPSAPTILITPVTSNVTPRRGNAGGRQSVTGQATRDSEWLGIVSNDTEESGFSPEKGDSASRKMDAGSEWVAHLEDMEMEGHAARVSEWVATVDE